MRRVVVRAAFAGALFVPSVAVAQAPAPACTAPVTSCSGESGYYVSADDRDKLEKQLEPLLKELRACIDAAGGKHAAPQIVIRFDGEGKPVSSKVEAGGYESLPCVGAVEGKLVNARSVHETFVRCEYGCPKPKPPPAPAPVVVPPAPTAQPAAPPPVATAPPPPAPAAAAPPARRVHTEKVWYGWQNLVADAGSATLVGIGVASKTPGLTAAGFIGYAFASPVVHWVHGNIGPGFGSLGMRVLLPPIGLVVGLLAGVIVGAGRANNSIEEAGSAIAVGAIAGTATGMLIPVAIDAAALGWEKVEVEDAPQTAKAKPPAFTIVPTINGVAGTF